jgi:hypothetical protein
MFIGMQLHCEITNKQGKGSDRYNGKAACKTSLLRCMLVIDMALRRNASFPEKGGGCCTATMFMVKYLATLQLPQLQYCCKDRHTTIIKHRYNSTHEIP